MLYLLTAPGLKKTPSWLLLVEAIDAKDTIELAGLIAMGEFKQFSKFGCNVEMRSLRFSIFSI